MADLSGEVPRVIALIDLPDLQWQMKRISEAFGHDVTAVLEQLEAGVAKLAPAPKAWLSLGVVYLYSPSEVKRECWGCYRACTHCQAGMGGQGRGNSMAKDLLELAREDEYDWAVVVSADLLLIPVVRYLQSHGRKIIHGCFPPVAMDLTKECWASIDLSPLSGGARSVEDSNSS